MFIARAKRSGFTLLEIVIAVAILAMMSLAIYRFVNTNVTALRVSTDASRDDAQYAGFTNLLAAEWQTLPPGRGALTGEPLKLNDQSRDQLTWLNSAGPGLLTRYASGDYTINLRMRPIPKTRDQMEIGVVRKAEADAARGETENDSWVSLLQNVRSLQIRYYDPRLNAWVDRWTDTVTLPRLIKIAIGRGKDPIPWETVIALGRTPL